MHIDFDILIVGGGMVGASLARALANTDMKIGMIEAWAYNSDNQPSYDDRAIALSFGSRLIFEGIGLWPTVHAKAAPIRYIHISDRGHFGFTRLDHNDQGVEALGYVVTGQFLGQLLMQDLDRERNIELFCPAQLKSFEVTPESAVLNISYEGGLQQLSSRLLIAADGAKSMIRERLGVQVDEWSYGQTAVTSNLTPTRATPGVAYERFTNSGPMAMLPLTDGRYGLIWTLSEEDEQVVLALNDAQFIDRVQHGFGYRLGEIKRVGKRASYPLKLLRTREHVRPRVAIIGNAAHALHPVTGQGFNLGLRDVAVLAEVIADAHRQDLDIGSPQVLAGYAGRRRVDQQAMALITDGLVRLFTNPLAPIKVARNLGLVALDLMPPAKRLLTRQFMGLHGHLPRISRGLPLV